LILNKIAILLLAVALLCSVPLLNANKEDSGTLLLVSIVGASAMMG
jgi:hypothetical protein